MTASAPGSRIADIRTRYGPDLPFFLSRLSNSQTNINANGLSTIRAAQEYVAANDPYTYLVDTDGMSVGTDNLHFNEPGQMALGEAFAQSYIGSVVPDETAPQIALLSPANGFAEHPATNNLVINFSEPVVFGTGFITVRKADGTLIESFDVANPPANLSSNLSGATLTIDLSSNLNYSTGYYVEIDPTAIKDNSGNSFAGLSGPSTWSFTTAAGQVFGLIGGSGITVSVSSLNGDGSNYPPQTVVNGTGLNGSGEHAAGGKSEWVSNIGADIANGFISFDLGGSYVLDSMHVWNCTQFVNYGIKQLDIYVSDVFSAGDPEGAGASNWTKIADNVSFAAAGSPNVGFDLETQTGISLPATAVRHVRFEIDTNQAGSTSGYVGLAEVQFFAAASGPDATEPTIASLNPANGASGVPTTASPAVTFSEAVAFGTGFITINPTADLSAATGYYVEIDATAIDDLAGNSFAGISGSTTWSFTTYAPETTPPTISSLKPVNAASGVPTTANPVATFSEAVAFGTGFIRIRNTSGGTLVESYDVASPPANLTLSGSILTINPTANLAASTGYYVEIDPTAIDDLAGNSFAGISGSATWSFTTAAGQAGGLILQPSSMTATSQAGAVYNASFSRDQSGFLSGSYTSGVSDFATTLATLQHKQGNGGTQGGTSIGWASSLNPSLKIDPKAASNPGVIMIDMGSTVSVSRLGIWMYLNGSPVNGGSAFDSTKDFEVFSSDSATLASATPTSLGVFALPDPNTARTGVAFDITDATSRYFVINVRSLHTDTTPAGNDHASFGEIAFEAANVNPGNDFSNWISGFSVGGQTGINGDYDNDGLGNALENLMGTSPAVFNPGLTSVSVSGGNLVFRHTLSSTPASDLTGSYEWSANLVDWNASGASSVGTTVTFATPAVIRPGTPDLVEVTASATGTPTARIFARYKAIQN